MVPLRLRINQSVVWENMTPSSTRLCRPIGIKYARETAELSRAERQHIEAEINRLQPTILTTPSGNRVEIRHNLHLTMIDGKVIGALAETGSATCNVCGATPNAMNDLSVVTSRQVRSEILQFGLSTLHAWIRVFECVLHISYKLPIKKWRTGNEREKAEVSERQRLVRRRLRDEMQLVVDQPQSGGSGTTNDGNTARRAFKDVRKFSEATGVDVKLLQRFAVILSALSSSSTIDVGKYQQYAMETAQLYVSLYPWYKMPASLHKILVHGADIIGGLELPIGAYSEEAQEARNKHNRQYRLRHARKTSREDTITDQFGYLLLTSDPVISELIEKHYNKPQRRRTHRVDREGIDISPLLRDDEVGSTDEDDQDDGCDDVEAKELM